jgi:translocator protein
MRINRDIVRQFINIMALSITVAFNAISQALPLNNQTNADVANRYPDLLYFPANYAFSIWGVIYLLLTAFIVYQALPSQRNNVEIRKIGYWFVITSALNIAWIFMFQYNQFVLSMVVMILLLISLLVIYIRLDIGGKVVSLRGKLLVHVPFSVYLGWITAATVTNAAYVLTDLGWDGFGIPDQTWAVIMLVVTGVIAAFMLLTRRDIAYGLVIVWATFAIAMRYTETEYNTTVTAALAVAGAVTLLIILTIVRMIMDRQRVEDRPLEASRA